MPCYMIGTPPTSIPRLPNLKATREQIRQRVALIMKIRLLGAGLADIQEFCKQEDPETGRPWKVSRRTVYRYIEASEKLIAHEAKRNPEKHFTEHLARRRMMYARAMEQGDIRTALAVAQDEARLRGLY